MDFSPSEPQPAMAPNGAVGGPLPLPRRGGAPGTQGSSGKRMEPWRGCPLFPREGWEDRSSNSLGGVNRLEEVPEGVTLKIRLGVHEGTKAVWFPDWLDPWEVHIDGIRTRWGTTPPGQLYKAQLFEVNPQTDRMASGGVYKTRTLYELEAKTDDDVEIGRQDWPIHDTTGVPQEILDEIEARKEEREANEEAGDPTMGSRGAGRGDPRFAQPQQAQGNPFAPGSPTIPQTNPFAGAGTPHPQGFQNPQGYAQPGYAPQNYAQPGYQGMPGTMPSGAPGAMAGPQMPPAPGYEWVWQSYPQGGGTFVQREVAKPAPQAPASDSATTAALVGLGTTVLTGALTLLEKWVSRPAVPQAPAPPSAMESLASKLIERQLTAPAQAPTPAVDPKAIEASVRLEYELKSLRREYDQLARRDARTEAKAPASEDFLKQLERYQELADRLNPGSARDEAQGTLEMVAGLANTEGGKELMAKVGEGFARWLNAQPTPTMSTGPAQVVLAPAANPASLPAPAPAVTAESVAKAPALDPEGHFVCLDCGGIFRAGTPEAGTHAGHTISRMTTTEVLT